MFKIESEDPVEVIRGYGDEVFKKYDKLFNPKDADNDLQARAAATLEISHKIIFLAIGYPIFRQTDNLEAATDKFSRICNSHVRQMEKEFKKLCTEYYKEKGDDKQ